MPAPPMAFTQKQVFPQFFPILPFKVGKRMNAMASAQDLYPVILKSRRLQQAVKTAYIPPIVLIVLLIVSFEELQTAQGIEFFFACAYKLLLSAAAVPPQVHPPVRPESRLPEIQCRCGFSTFKQTGQSGIGASHFFKQTGWINRIRLPAVLHAFSQSRARTEIHTSAQARGRMAYCIAMHNQRTRLGQFL